MALLSDFKPLLSLSTLMLSSVSGSEPFRHGRGGEPGTGHFRSPLFQPPLTLYSAHESQVLIWVQTSVASENIYLI